MACVVVTPVGPSGLGLFHDVGAGVLLTAYHPVLQGGAWAFPVDCGPEVSVETDAYFNVVLEEGGAGMAVVPGPQGGVAVVGISLGHGIEGDAVASHEFLGTMRVRAALEGMVGWARGVVVLDPARTQRCPITQRIVGLGEFPVDSENMPSELSLPALAAEVACH